MILGAADTELAPEQQLSRFVLDRSEVHNELARLVKVDEREQVRSPVAARR